MYAAEHHLIWADSSDFSNCLLYIFSDMLLTGQCISPWDFFNYILAVGASLLIVIYNQDFLDGHRKLRHLYSNI